jgi:gamma-glutamyl-gamma-aminobutyrate hydrolase PuuD
MKIAISLETTRALRNTWHSAINHEWYEFLAGHEIRPLVSRSSADLSGIDFLILCGGNDMPGMPTWRDNHDAVRDAFEHELLSQARASNIPVMGVCRGFHFMNLHCGGSLKYLETPYDNVPVDLFEVQVTCHHTIGIDQLAPGFECMLADALGVIELARDPQRRFLGVGWHPERAVNAHTRSRVLELMESL